MNKPQPSADKKYELLASAITIVFAYYAIRISLILPKFREMLAGVDMEENYGSFAVFLMAHHNAVGSWILIAILATLASIWIPYKHSKWVVAIGIIFLGISSQVLWSAAMSPFFQMINAMGV